MVGLTMENCGFPIQPGKMVGLTMENHGKWGETPGSTMENSEKTMV
jgi:hypothetical protein